MHRIYSSSGIAIYPLVFNLEWLLTDSDDDDDAERNRQGTIKFIDFWLNSIARNSKGAPVLLIGTHKDKVAGCDYLRKTNLELFTCNPDIKRAHKIIADYVKSMPVYKSKILNLHFPKQPSPLNICYFLRCFFFS